MFFHQVHPGPVSYGGRHLHRLFQVVQHLNDTRAALDATAFKVVEIPVCYGKEFGPDIGNVLTASGLTQEQVIQVHAAPGDTISFERIDLKTTHQIYHDEKKKLTKILACM